MKNLTLLLVCLPLFAAGQNPNVTVQDDAKVGLIVTGTGNTINTTQIFGKSPEYAEIKKSLANLDADIQKKAATCEKMAKDNLPAEYRDGCRSELIALNARRDSVAKIETRFREDVLRLAETFSKMEINSRRLFEADSLFKIGKIREAETLLNFKEITKEDDALLAKKERLDSLLLIKANELALKAQLKAADYGDPLRYDSAELYFNQSLRYAENVDNLWNFAQLLYYDNRADRAFIYWERALKAARSESEEASLAMNLGVAYSDVQNMAEAERMYLRSLEIRERLATSNPAQFEPDLAMTAMNLGLFLFQNEKAEAGEASVLRANQIFRRCAADNPGQHDLSVSRTCWILGFIQKSKGEAAAARALFEESKAIASHYPDVSEAQQLMGMARAQME